MHAHQEFTLESLVSCIIYSVALGWIGWPTVSPARKSSALLGDCAGAFWVLWLVCDNVSQTWIAARKDILQNKQLGVSLLYSEATPVQ